MFGGKRSADAAPRSTTLAFEADTEHKEIDMSVKLTTLASAGVAAVAAFAAAPAWAHDDAPVASKKTQASQPATVVVIKAAAALTVVRDTQTGEMRAPTADEANALVMAARAPDGVASPSTARPFSTASGAPALHLGEDALAFSVVRRNLDGSLTEVCVTGPKEARKALRAPRLATSTRSLKELPNE